MIKVVPLMASVNGICKNCGSLIVADDRDPMCECLFCDCVFPTMEAVEIAKNPRDYTFPNEPQPKRDSTRRYTSVPVFPDPVPVAVKQAESLAKAEKKEKNPYEVSADDIKAPKKTLLAIAAIAFGFVFLVFTIFLPLYVIRTGHKKDISLSIETVFSDAGISVNTEKREGYPMGYSISGQTNNNLIVVTSDEIDENKLGDLYEGFAKIRADEYGYDSSDTRLYYGGLRLEIIAQNGTFAVIAADGAEQTQMSSQVYTEPVA